MIDVVVTHLFSCHEGLDTQGFATVDTYENQWRQNDSEENWK